MCEPRELEAGIRERVNRTEHAYRFLVDEVLRGRWQAGDTISTYGIADELEISRTPVSEALKRLEAEGLVEIIPQVGSRIVGTSAGALAELFALRDSLDGLAAEAAAARIGADDLAELDTLLRRMDAATEANDRAAFTDLNARFHLRIVRASRLPRTIRAARNVWLPLRHQLGGAPHHARMGDSAPEHREIVEALRRGSPKRARAAAERHATASGARILARLDGPHRDGLEHRALIYDSADAFLAGSVPFLRAGLDRGERVLAVTTPANIDALERALGSPSQDVEFRDSAEWYRAPSHTLLAYERYVAYSDRRPVRVLGEPFLDRITPASMREWSRYEAIINVEFAYSPIAFLCPYDAREMPGELVANVRRTHPEIVDGATSAANPDYTNARVLTRALDDSPFEAAPPGIAEHAVTRDLRGVREFTIREGMRAGLSGKRLAEALLAVQEIAANVLEHGGGGGTLRAWVTDGELVYEVDDDGPGVADPLAVHLTPELAGRSGPGGLWIARLLCDLVEVRATAGGFAVRLHLRLP